jgi:hypothetical protein
MCYVKRLLLILVILGGVGCAWKADTILPSGQIAKEFLYPYDSTEFCVDSEAISELIEYSFESTLPVTFDIHYHNESDDVNYLQKQKVSSSEKGSFKTVSPDTYCMTLYNHQAKAVWYSALFRETRPLLR